MFTRINSNVRIYSKLLLLVPSKYTFKHFGRRDCSGCRDAAQFPGPVLLCPIVDKNSVLCSVTTSSHPECEYTLIKPFEYRYSALNTSNGKMFIYKKIDIENEKTDLDLPSVIFILIK